MLNKGSREPILLLLIEVQFCCTICVKKALSWGCGGLLNVIITYFCHSRSAEVHFQHFMSNLAYIFLWVVKQM